MALPPNAIDEIAFAWAAKIDRAELDERDQAALDAWIGADSRHAGAFARAMAASLHLDRAVALGPDFDPERRAPLLPPPRGISRRHVMIGGSAVAIAAIGMGVTYSVRQRGKRVATARGVIQRYPLADGSSMVLNTATQVELDFDREARRVALLNGEAQFDVVKDPARPFIVTAGDVTVRAVGTRFSVWRLGEDRTRVVVAEGIVELGGKGQGQITRLIAGQMAGIAGDGTVSETSLPSERLDQATAWTGGLIDMDGLSLGEAAAQFRRYSDVRIELGDAQVAALRVSGTYSINNALGFARDAALSLDLDAVETDHGILIRRKN
nr:FecR domain-containing protein [uncultured Sphingomonas sp.]